MTTVTYYNNLSSRFDRYVAGDLVVEVDATETPDDRIGAAAAEAAWVFFQRIDTPHAILDFHGAPSMSVGDVVRVGDGPDFQWWAVADLGWTQLDGEPRQMARLGKTVAAARDELRESTGHLCAFIFDEGQRCTRAQGHQGECASETRERAK